MKKRLKYYAECYHKVNDVGSWQPWWWKLYCFLWLVCNRDWKGTRQKYKRMKRDARKRFA